MDDSEHFDGSTVRRRNVWLVRRLASAALMVQQFYLAPSAGVTMLECVSCDVGGSSGGSENSTCDTTTANDTYTRA